MSLKRCISQMCVCGRHRCPKKYLKEAVGPSMPAIPKLPLSEYRDLEARQPARSDLYHAPTMRMEGPSGMPFTGASTYQNDFVAPKGVAPVRGKLQEMPPPPEGMYYMDSTHRSDFTPQPINVRTPYKQMGHRTVPPAFEAASTYQNDYTPPPLIKRDTFGPPSASISDSEGLQRIPIKSQVPGAVECKTCYQPDKTPKTTYQDSYGSPIGGVCPAALIHSTSPSGEPLYRHVGSTQGHEYFIRAA